MVMRLLLSFSQAGKTASEIASLLGTSLGQFASAGLREKQRDISALFLSGQSLSLPPPSSVVGRSWGGGCPSPVVTGQEVGYTLDRFQSISVLSLLLHSWRYGPVTL
ncbi:hypothetical protein AMECASPLE_032588 [Ameca splendens]|uniref:Uncharacterized protein n=1 Tax=Ameca splendens TaxID=208324 RepID=A0ABV0YI25_9TELE